jgi:hypothetical protein
MDVNVASRWVATELRYVTLGPGFGLYLRTVLVGPVNDDSCGICRTIHFGHSASFSRFRIIQGQAVPVSPLPLGLATEDQG